MESDKQTKVCKNRIDLESLQTMTPTYSPSWRWAFWPLNYLARKEMVQCVMVSLENSQLEVSWSHLQGPTQFQRNSRNAPFSTPPSHSAEMPFKTNTCSQPHWLLRGSLIALPKTNEEAPTLQFPLFQFMLPVEMHSKEKINIKCESG